MTLREFAPIFAALAMQLRQTDADEATIRVCYEPLQDLEVEFVAIAAQRLAQSAEWFPKTSEWRAMAASVEAERVEAQRALLRKLPAPLCVACDDTGWTEDTEAPRRVLKWLRPGRGDPIPMVASQPRKRCDCQTLRRLELLGRRPWPALPAADRGNDDGAETASLRAQIERHTGRRIVPRAMPEPRREKHDG